MGTSEQDQASQESWELSAAWPWSPGEAGRLVQGGDSARASALRAAGDLSCVYFMAYSVE